MRTYSRLSYFGENASKALNPFSNSTSMVVKANDCLLGIFFVDVKRRMINASIECWTSSRCFEMLRQEARPFLRARS